MKILVVYYCRSGHTHRMAREIAKRCGADLDPIQEVHDGASWWARLRARWQAVRRAEAPIRRPGRNPARYDLVIIGSPTLKTGIVPPVRSYVRQYGDRFKQVAFFSAEGGAAAQRGFAELTRLCGREPVASFAVDAERSKLPPAAHREGLSDFMHSMQRQ